MTNAPFKCSVCAIRDVPLYKVECIEEYMESRDLREGVYILCQRHLESNFPVSGAGENTYSIREVGVETMSVKTQKKNGKDKGYKGVVFKAVFDKEKDRVKLVISLSKRAKKLVDLFKVDESTDQPCADYNNGDRNKKRFRVRRSIANSVNLSGRTGVLFDKTDYNTKEKEVFCENFAQVCDTVNDFRYLFEIMNKSAVEMKKEYTAVIYFKDDKQKAEQDEGDE